MATKIVDSTALDAALGALESFVMKKSTDLPLIFHATIATKPATVNAQSTANPTSIEYCTATKRFYAKSGTTYYDNWLGRDLYQNTEAYRKLFYKPVTSGYELYTIDAAGALVKIPSDYYNKTEIDAKITTLNTAINTKATASNVYTKTEVDTKLNTKANTSTTYTKTEVDTKLGTKADTSTTYTKTEVDTKLGTKANSADVYNKTTSDSRFLKTADYTVMTAAEAEKIVSDLFG